MTTTTTTEDADTVVVEEEFSGFLGPRIVWHGYPNHSNETCEMKVNHDHHLPYWVG